MKRDTGRLKVALCYVVRTTVSMRSACMNSPTNECCDIVDIVGGGNHAKDGVCLKGVAVLDPLCKESK